MSVTKWDVGAIEVTVCNCTRADNRGLLDLEPSDYCRSPNLATQPIDAEYKVYTLDNPQIKIEGFTCVAWEEKKTIVGYFFGSYDTIFETITRSVTADECKRMARFHECGGPNIKMTIDDGSYVYNGKPDCKGKYWQTERCITLNCVLSPVTLTQKCPTCNVNSPYGRLTNNSEEASAIHGHRTFIWEPRGRQNTKSCNLKAIHNGTGRILSMDKEKKERLVDRVSQLEFHYIKDKEEKKNHESCNVGSIYKVIGVPDTWIEIKTNTASPEPWADQLIRNKSAVATLTAWGAIKSGNIDACLLASFNPGKVSRPAAAVGACEGKRFQNFELTVDGMLKVNDLIVTNNLAYQTQTYCLVVNPSGELQSLLCPLEQKYSRSPWLYNHVTKRISSAGLCLALWAQQSTVSSQPNVLMNQCDSTRRSQDWFIEFRRDDKGKVIRDGAFKNNIIDLTPVMKRMDIFPLSDNGTNEPRSLLVEHHQYTEGRAIDRENILSDELHTINCEMNKLKKYQIMAIAQNNGFMAAAAANLPECQRLLAHGSALMIQKCKSERVNITGRLGPCGIEPSYLNYTVGLDGFSLYPFKPCFRKGNIVSLNNKAYIWQNSDWEETKANIQLNNIILVGKFEEIDDNENEYMLKPHDAYDRVEEEQINRINDLVTMMHGTNINALQVVMDETTQNNIPEFNFWPKVLQKFWIIFTIVIIILILSVIIKYFIKNKMGSSKKWKRRAQSLELCGRSEHAEEMAILEPIAAPVESIIGRPKWSPVTKTWSMMGEGETAV
jgi:hypothetical protein